MRNTPKRERALASALRLCASAFVLGIVAAAPASADAPAAPLSKEQLAASWRDMASLPDFWQGTWQSISPIADDFPQEPDYTQSALDHIKTYKPAADSPFANCKPLGLPFLMNIGGMPMKFFQSPGMIALYVESSGMTRFIHTDGRQHSAQPNPSFLGESIAHWEGDTLVIDSTGFDPETLFQIAKLKDKNLKQGDFNPMSGVVFGPHGPNLRIVERMKLIDFKTLESQTTLYDDTVFKQPVTLAPRRFLRGIERRNEPQEWACTDNRDYLDPTTGKLQYNVKDKAISR
ncbi:hypothetical protein CCR94_03490 [Rhodoblastus sphagnicola]|uniref:Uncharacterized protein n=1 Tax=Rhodoblastus sphagnicola TaxID=333368 RepID=A0A2S6NEB1_9HYPH|nr:hypothetical protein [Rhodoblastus sphagnicola]MBB4199885.1 hypothetical protein [Rhodoblastus sphagnicola]PPQ32941.1 hypothetical protein CCR94_03490 [Rhodoblastus sphagnicola]